MRSRRLENDCGRLITQSVSQFSCSVMSSSLRLYGLWHASLPCPSPTPGACSNSCPSSRWCHPTISSSVISFSSHLQSFPGSGSFPMNQFFTSGGQSIGVSASTSILPMNIQDWFPLGLTGWNHLAVQEALKSLLQQHRNSCKTDSELRWLRAHLKLIHVDDETKCREERT